jgi:hypothetical protein
LSAESVFDKGASKGFDCGSAILVRLGGRARKECYKVGSKIKAVIAIIDSMAIKSSESLLIYSGL